MDVDHPEAVADGVGLLDGLDDHLGVERLQAADAPRFADAEAEAHLLDLGLREAGHLLAPEVHVAIDLLAGLRESRVSSSSSSGLPATGHML